MSNFSHQEGDTINVDVTCPGATLALAMIYLKTNNRYQHPPSPVLHDAWHPFCPQQYSLLMCISHVLEQPDVFLSEDGAE